ncbi:hypothetical protein BKA65DRAFT_491666 [Rhexocercosporidium sp. MPI-PUGE-AT-0058]|nr:hypothetical protein BKA65DRAFT_491666 [Rhexocercosporidium sp. MPI-PUGE-AT-0058]
MAEKRRQKRPREGSIEESEHIAESRPVPSNSTSSTEPYQSAEGSLASYPPPSGYSIDRLNHHIDLEDFGKSLQEAANAVFAGAGNRRSRYSNVSVILFSWEDEDPNLPVSLEIAALKHVFVNLYGYEAIEWQIPNLNSHTALNLRILQFLAEGDCKNLKIIYYAGHGKLSSRGQAVWTSYGNCHAERPPMVKWSGIQNALEESESDVLILLDCCASGLSNTDEGNGVTELLAACAFNNTTKGVGPFSFTHVLISQLKNLVSRPSFTIGYLYNLMFAQVQALPVKSAEYRKPPIHLVLTQDHRFPRSITLSCRKPEKQDIPDISMDMLEEHADQYAVLDSVDQSSLSDESEKVSDSSLFANSSESPATSLSLIPEYPRLLFSIRMSEDINPRTLSPELFADWLSALPMEAKSVRVEADFASDSTLLMVSMLIALMGYLPRSEAISLLGTVRSNNLLSTDQEGSKLPKSVVTSDPKVELEDIFMNDESKSPSQDHLEEEMDVATPRPIDTLLESSHIHMDTNTSPTDGTLAGPLAAYHWGAHLAKKTKPFQLNSIYNKWSMEKLEVVARSAVTAYHVRKQDEQMSLLQHKIDSMIIHL